MIKLVIIVFLVFFGATVCRPQDITKINYIGVKDCKTFPPLPSITMCTPVNPLVDAKGFTPIRMFTQDLPERLPKLDFVVETKIIDKTIKQTLTRLLFPKNDPIADAPKYKTGLFGMNLNSAETIPEEIFPYEDGDTKVIFEGKKFKVASVSRIQKKDFYIPVGIHYLGDGDYSHQDEKRSFELPEAVVQTLYKNKDSGEEFTKSFIAPYYEPRKICLEYSPMIFDNMTFFVCKRFYMLFQNLFVETPKTLPFKSCRLTVKVLLGNGCCDKRPILTTIDKIITDYYFSGYTLVATDLSVRRKELEIPKGKIPYGITEGSFICD